MEIQLPDDLSSEARAAIEKSVRDDLSQMIGGLWAALHKQPADNVGAQPIHKMVPSLPPLVASYFSNPYSGSDEFRKQAYAAVCLYLDSLEVRKNGVLASNYSLPLLPQPKKGELKLSESQKTQMLAAMSPERRRLVLEQRARWAWEAGLYSHKETVMIDGHFVGREESVQDGLPIHNYGSLVGVLCQWVEEPEIDKDKARYRKTLEKQYDWDEFRVALKSDWHDYITGGIAIWREEGLAAGKIVEQMQPMWPQMMKTAQTTEYNVAVAHIIGYITRLSEHLVLNRLRQHYMPDSPSVVKWVCHRYCGDLMGNATWAVPDHFLPLPLRTAKVYSFAFAFDDPFMRHVSKHPQMMSYLNSGRIIHQVYTPEASYTTVLDGLVNEKKKEHAGVLRAYLEMDLKRVVARQDKRLSRDTASLQLLVDGKIKAGNFSSAQIEVAAAQHMASEANQQLMEQGLAPHYATESFAGDAKDYVKKRRYELKKPDRKKDKNK